MAELWQLKNTTTNELIGDPQRLPKNWGSIFGMENVKDKLDDLSWVGINDQGWFLVGDDGIDLPLEQTLSEKMWQKAKDLLKESDWSMLPDVPLNSGKKDEWEDYRAALRDIKAQEGFPESIVWPLKPAD